jgi:hypothetical protein
VPTVVTTRAWSGFRCALPRPGSKSANCRGSKEVRYQHYRWEMPRDARPIAPAGVTSSAELIAAYFRQYGTLPKISASPVGEGGQLYRRLARIRLLKRKGKLDQAAALILDEACPGWTDGYGFKSDRIWQDRRDALIAWMDAQGRPPHYASGDSAERALASWVAGSSRLVGN